MTSNEYLIETIISFLRNFAWMHKYKMIISAALLSVYALVFAHNLIPHCHQLEFLGGESHEMCVHQNHEHHTAGNASTDHEHVYHNGHMDEGLFDFLICVLSEVEHPSTGTDAMHYLESDNDFRLSAFEWIINVQPLAAILNIELEDEASSGAFIVEQEHASSLLLDTASPLRGPPIIL